MHTVNGLAKQITDSANNQVDLKVKGCCSDIIY